MLQENTKIKDRLLFPSEKESSDILNNLCPLLFLTEQKKPSVCL